MINRMSENAIMRILDSLETKYKNQASGKIRVVYADGTAKMTDPGEAIELILHPDGEIIDFQGNEGQGNGKMVSLLKGLLEA